jgi:hypothetical protein
MMLSNCASGSGSWTGGENWSFPLCDDVLGLVRWLGADWRFPADATEDAVPCGDIGRLGAGELGRIVWSWSSSVPFRFTVASVPVRVLELSIR